MVTKSNTRERGEKVRQDAKERRIRAARSVLSTPSVSDRKSADSHASTRPRLAVG
ncbi:hypothetical protein [Mycetocola tolaasinivorans]|uniref:hypothetical protein n=1 Tax=Mycetocola tolaasinivorans TaxID=76635 RepID=UPI001601ED2A|nr:hypothetical protein [Mycetocola tolaasinivorans]